MRTAAYCRFSSDLQREASIRDQLRNIEAFCARMGWPVPALYQDQAISGARNDRPGYQAMLEAADLGVFEVLLLDDLSRLSRDHIECAQAIRRLKFIGVRIIGVSDGTDTAREGHKLDIGMRGLISEIHNDELARKTHRGLMGQALDGYSAGGLAFGYRSAHDGQGFKRSIDAEQAQWVRLIFERYAAGSSPRAIADELNALKVASPRGGSWSHTAIYPDSKGVGMLGNPLYNGRQIWNRTNWVKDPVSGRRRRRLRPMAEWVIVEAPELKIIDDDLWALCVARAKGQKRDTARRAETTGKSAGGRGPKYLFSGILKCGICGAPFTIYGRHFYACSWNRSRGDSVCDNRLTLRRVTAENVLLASVKESLLTDAAFRAFEAEARAMLKELRPDPSAARRSLTAALRERDNLIAAIKAGIITPSTRQALLDAEQAASEAQEDLQAIERFEPTQMLPRAREIYRDLVERLENIEDIPAAREALRTLLGDVRLIPESGKLTAEIQSAGLAGALQITLVAGARSERYLRSGASYSPIRITGLA